jgi:hypothetical protein
MTKSKDIRVICLVEHIDITSFLDHKHFIARTHNHYKYMTLTSLSSRKLIKLLIVILSTIDDKLTVSDKIVTHIGTPFDRNKLFSINVTCFTVHLIMIISVEYSISAQVIPAYHGALDIVRRKHVKNN